MRLNKFLLTGDKTKISLLHFHQRFDKAIIISCGFYNNKDTFLIRRLIRILLPFYDVLAFDYRGHGKSGGFYTFGSKEQQDLEAVLGYANSFPYCQKGLIGFSIGAGVAISVACRKDSLDSLVLVSCPSNFHKIDYHFWEKGMLRDLVDFFGPVGRGKGARIGNPFLRKRHPRTYISKLKIPVLFIHGKKDWVIKPWHTRVLYAKKQGRKRMVIFNEGLHAEKLLDQYPREFKDLIVAWFSKTLR